MKDTNEADVYESTENRAEVKNIQNTSSLDEKIRQGLKPQEIAESENCKVEKVYSYVKESGQSELWEAAKKFRKKEIETFIDGKVREGLNAREIAELNKSLTEGGVHNYIKSSGQLNLWKEAKKLRRKNKRIPSIDEKIRQGLKTQEIADAEKSCVAAVHSYITSSGQLEIWNKAKELRFLKEEKERKEKKSALEEMAEKLRDLELLKAAEAGWPYYNAVIYDRRDTTNKHSFEKVLKFLKAYNEEKIELGVASCLRAAKKSGFNSYSSVQGIVEFLGLQSGEHPKPITEDKLNAIKNAQAVPYLTLNDVAYFIGVASESITNHWQKDGKLIKIVRPRSNLSYRKASQVYEAIDAGFNLEETAEYAGVHPSFAERAVENRNEIEPRIVEALKVIFPKSKLKKPYI